MKWVAVVFVYLLSVKYAYAEIKIVTEHWYPYNYVDENGEIVGLATKKVKAIFDSLNLSYSIESYPWARSIMLAQKNDNTLIYSIFKTPERKNKFQWICPLLPPVKINLYKLKSRKEIVVSDLSDAKNYVVSINRDDSAHEYLKTQGFVDGKNIDLSSSEEVSTKKLLAKRVDLIMQTEHTMKQRLSSLGFSLDYVEKVAQVDNFNENNICMAFNLTTDKKLVKLIQKSLDEMNKKQAKLN